MVYTFLCFLLYHLSHFLVHLFSIAPDEILAQQIGESRNQIQRYIRLSELISPILEKVDNKEISFNSAVEISYLNKTEQLDLLDIMKKEDGSPTISQAQRIKNTVKKEN